MTDRTTSAAKKRPTPSRDKPFRQDRSAAKKYVPWRDRLLWLLVPVAMAVATFWFAAFFIWPLVDGIVTLTLLFGMTIYLALFVWPYEEDDGGW